MREPPVIAVCGKGGVGKTSIAATLVRLLGESPRRRVLAIDADPAAGLVTALGLEGAVRRTVDDLRNDTIGQLTSRHRSHRRALLAELDYGLLEALVERDNRALLAIGRPERPGCFCSVNDLLRDLIAVLADGFDVVVIDGEAGLEQINRRVIEQVTRLIVVSDASARGLKVARSLHALAGEALGCNETGLLLNRLHGPAELASLELPDELELLGWLPEDETLRDADRRGDSLLELPDTPFVMALRDVVATLGSCGEDRASTVPMLEDEQTVPPS